MRIGIKLTQYQFFSQTINPKIKTIFMYYHENLQGFRKPLIPTSLLLPVTGPGEPVNLNSSYRQATAFYRPMLYTPIVPFVTPAKVCLSV